VSVADALRTAAEEVLGSLSDEQRARAGKPFEVAGERQRWFYTPTDHGGLLLSELSPVQHQSVGRLIAVALSEGGYNTAMAVMALETILDHDEGWPGRPNMRVRDPLRYSITVFGEPSGDRWGWRIGGHHVSLNFTIAGDAVAATPCFLGADPSTAPLLGDDVYAPLQGAEELAREIVRGLSDDEREWAVLSAHAPWDLVLSNRSQPEAGATPRRQHEIFRDDPEVLRPLMGDGQQKTEQRLGIDEADLERLSFAPEPKGINVASLESSVQQRVGGLVSHYVRRLADALAEPILDANPSEMLHFAWSGSMEPREPHYYRIHGPSVLIEYANVQRHAGHIHAVLRDPRGDFGVGLLSAH
jgi:uncharacterized protein DUF3500